MVMFPSCFLADRLACFGGALWRLVLELVGIFILNTFQLKQFNLSYLVTPHVIYQVIQIETLAFVPH